MKEIGIHNPAFAMTIALSPTLLNGAEMALKAVVYGIVMFLHGGQVRAADHSP